MKKTSLLAFALSLALLTGCGGEGEYYTETAHNEKEPAHAASGGDSDISGYYTLRGAILNMVSLGVAEDVFRIGSYNGDLDSDLKSVIQEITLEEPLGIYGVLSISVDQARVLTYQELSVSIQYKRPVETLRSVVQINSEYDLQSRIVQMLRHRESQGVFQVADGLQLNSTIHQEIYSAWMNCGADAQGLDYVSVDFYPEGQDDCILEMCPVYLFDDDEKQARAEKVRTHAEALSEELLSLPEEQQLEEIRQWLLEHTVYDNNASRVINETQGGQRKSGVYTAYGALVEGEAAQSGFVLAASVLLETCGVEHSVLTGMVGGDIYSWIVLSVQGHPCVFDVTAQQNGREAWLYTEQEAEGFFVEW
ncbi:MAG: hypothetical protein ACI3XT_05385 [Butyricicoccaceae bacterium]